MVATGSDQLLTSQLEKYPVLQTLEYSFINILKYIQQDKVVRLENPL